MLHQMHTLATVIQKGDWLQVERFFNESEGVRLFGATVHLDDPTHPEVRIARVADKHRGGAAGPAVNGAVQAALHDLAIGLHGLPRWTTGVSATSQLQIDYIQPMLATSVRIVSEVEEVVGNRLYAISRCYNERDELCSLARGTVRLNLRVPKGNARPAAPTHTGPAFWDARYGEATFAYGTAPNEFFRNYLTQLAPGSLLLPAEGEGRNAVFAAELGWQVDAVDFSKAARQKARTLAAERGVSINYTTGDLLDFVPRNKYDAVAMIFFHADPAVRAKVLRRYQDFVRPGGGVSVRRLHAATNRNGEPQRRAEEARVLLHRS